MNGQFNKSPETNAKAPQPKSVEQVITDSTQEEFARILQKNMKHLKEVRAKNIKTEHPDFILKNELYGVLTARPELRRKGIDLFTRMPGWKDMEKQPEGWLDYKDLIKNLEHNFPNAEYDGAWLHFSYGDPTNTEEDGRRKKGYITIDTTLLPMFESHLVLLMHQINAKLSSIGYNGKMKISNSLKNLREKFDNFVVHGANKQEVTKALEAIKEVLYQNGITISGEQLGEDGKSLFNQDKSSHSMLLAEKVILGKEIS